MHIHILYSSGGGNTKYIVDCVAEQARSSDHTVTLSNTITADISELLVGDMTILACPTYDHGLLHTPFDLYIQKSREEGVDLRGHRYAIIGLGDPKYDQEYVVESALLLEQFVAEQGGDIYTPSLRLRGNPLLHIDVVESWVREILVG